MKKHGHYCKVCGEYKANEKFSGKGHASHICKSCASLPAEKQAELMTLNRLLNLPWRLSKEQLSWLKNRLKDRRPDVRACVNYKGIPERLPKLCLVDTRYQGHKVCNAFKVAVPYAQAGVKSFKGDEQTAHRLIGPQCKPDHHRQQQHINLPITGQRLQELFAVRLSHLNFKLIHSLCRPPCRAPRNTACNPFAPGISGKFLLGSRYLTVSPPFFCTAFNFGIRLIQVLSSCFIQPAPYSLCSTAAATTKASRPVMPLLIIITKPIA